MPTSFTESATSATASTRPSAIQVQLLNPGFASFLFQPFNAQSTVPSQASTTTQIEQINPSHPGARGYDKDTIYVVPSFEVPKSKCGCHHIGNPSLDTAPGVSERRLETSFFHQRGNVIDDNTDRTLNDLLDETRACEKRKKHEIATLEKDAVPPSGHYLRTLERSLRQLIPASSKIRILDSQTHGSEIWAHGFVKLSRSPATSPDSSDMGSDSEQYGDEDEDVDEDEDEEEYGNPAVSSDEEDYEGEEENITYHPRQGDYMRTFDSNMSP